jgi:REP element-mobilizing transposase RayT
MATIRQGQRALRRGRVSLPGHYYHVTCATVNRAALFTDWQRGYPVVDALRGAHAQTLAYCLMPDHLHWLLKLSDRTLAQVVGRMKGRSARAYRSRVSGAHPVWQRGYYDHAIRDDEALINVARYIVANPLRAGIVSKMGDYPLWDSVWL